MRDDAAMRAGTEAPIQCGYLVLLPHVGPVFIQQQLSCLEIGR